MGADYRGWIMWGRIIGVDYVGADYRGWIIWGRIIGAD